jgi:hypothetical protein
MDAKDSGEGKAQISPLHPRILQTTQEPLLHVKAK